MKRAIPWLFVLFLCAPLFGEDAAPVVRIVKVLHETRPTDGKTPLEQDIEPNDVGKFREMRDRLKTGPKGEYFSVFWKNYEGKPLQDVTVTLFYRQARKVDILSSSVHLADATHGGHLTEFRIVDEAFEKGGSVTAWKVVLQSADRQLTSFHSFLWQDPS